MAASAAARAERIRLGDMAGNRMRLDTLLADRGLFPTRSRAAVAVMAGDVRVGEQGRRAQKPGELVDPKESIIVSSGPAFVSRGGIKLANGLDSCSLEVSGSLALDVGASTGGFSDCLLQRGAARVVAVDVGYGLLAWKLRNDPRMTVLERTNARWLRPDLLPYAPGFACVDVSFISLELVLPAVLPCMAERHRVLALVKPQFEVGRERLGKGGVVRDANDRRAALVAVGAAALALGASVLGYHSSGLPGPKGNRETFIELAEPGHERAARDRHELLELARAVEP